MLKQELEENNNDDKINSDIKKVFALLNHEITKASIDSKGNFSFGMGSASAVRVAGNLKEIELNTEYLPERPGCADICPRQLLFILNVNLGINASLTLP
ncbi:MAG: hypothetical protein RQ756_00600 [Flavobacteriaceae bacterium]|nr:hypothetical protein [Flavobacteriaceae bacterium]